MASKKGKYHSVHQRTKIENNYSKGNFQKAMKNNDQSIKVCYRVFVYGKHITT